MQNGRLNVEEVLAMKGFRLTLVVLALVAALNLSGCASSMMSQVPPADPPDANHAVVTFMRPSNFGGAIQFGIWDGENFVGILSAGSSVQYHAEPGEHLFLGRAENWSYVSANLEGGKNYYILGNVFPGVWKARIAFDPVTKNDGTSKAELDKWIKTLTPTAVIPEKRDAYVKKHLPDIKRAIDKFQTDEVKFTVLEADDNR